MEQPLDDEDGGMDGGPRDGAPSRGVQEGFTDCALSELPVEAVDEDENTSHPEKA